MNDNKKYSLLILVLFVIGAIFTVAWGMFLNFGKLTVEAQAPFQINVIAGPSAECPQSPCSLDLKPGKHSVVFSKPGFREEKKDLEIERWDTNEVKVDFQFIAKVEEVTDTAKTDPAKQVDIPSSALASYLSPEGPGLIYLINQNDGKQALILRDGEEEEVISYFTKAFTKPALFVNDDSKTIVILESLEKQGELYLIDVEASSRKNIFQSADKIQTVKISPDGAKIAVLTEQKVFLISRDGSSEELNFQIEGTGLAWYDNETLALLSSSILNSDLEKSIDNGTAEGVSFQDYLAILDAAESVQEQVIEQKTVFVYLYNISSQTAERLVNVTGTSNLPDKLEVSQENDQKKLFFYDTQGKKFQVVFEQ